MECLEIFLHPHTTCFRQTLEDPTVDLLLILEAPLAPTCRPITILVARGLTIMIKAVVCPNLQTIAILLRPTIHQTTMDQCPEITLLECHHTLPTLNLAIRPLRLTTPVLPTPTLATP